MSTQMDTHAALVYTMVLISAASGDMTDQEISTMSSLVHTLPVFEGFDADRLGPIGRDCASLLNREDGLEVAFARIGTALSPRLRETAYALACEVVAADKKAQPEELRMLEMIRHRLDIERLVAAAIERGTRARYAQL